MAPGRGLRRRSARLASALGLLAAFAAGPAVAEEGAGEPQAAPVPDVGLDALLRLPRDTGPPARGVDRQRWESRFVKARGDLRDARARVADAQQQLEEIAAQSDAWQIAAPGAQPTAENSSLSYRLRQEIRDGRRDVDRAERALRELEVEASLAGIPPDWRALEAAEAPESAPGS